MVNKAKEVGLIVDQVYFSIDSPSKGIESIFVLVQGEKAEISVEKRGVLCNSKRVSYNDNWSWLGDNGYGKEGKGKIGAEAIISSVDIIAHKPTADE